MKIYIIKTDPESYSIEDFEKEKITLWDGVHNYQAINIIKKWEIGDLVLVYQSMGKADIAAVGRVAEAPFLNTLDPRYSFAAKIEHLITIPENERISLKKIKESGFFNDFALVRQSRLSVIECTENFINWIIAESDFLAGALAKHYK